MTTPAIPPPPPDLPDRPTIATGHLPPQAAVMQPPPEFRRRSSAPPMRTAKSFEPPVPAPPTATPGPRRWPRAAGLFVLGVAWPTVVAVATLLSVSLVIFLTGATAHALRLSWMNERMFRPLVELAGGVFFLGSLALAIKWRAWMFLAGTLVGVLALPLVGIVVIWIVCSGFHV